ncbi:MAG TPA: pilus (MSHA type) biogenesis protein MshL [Burkholderiales bacterium]|nr:pilus (MSHA type) biogenesis protein MshL [Burkholderiales bacterium]
MKRTSLAVIVAAVLASCSPFHVDQGALSEIESAAAQKGSQPNAVREALLPPLRAEMPKVPGAPVEPRFDLVVNAAPARQVFMSIVSGTRYSMIVNPGVSGTLSLNLKDVTVREALEAIREVYGYEFRADGTRIYVESAGLQTRVFQVNYLIGLRSGRSDVRVSSGAISGTQQGGVGAPAAAATGAGTPGQATSPALGAFGLSSIATAALDASRVSMVSQNDFWNEVTNALRALVGTAPGRNVVVSPQSGVVVVRAMPDELRSVEKYLKAMRLSIERQVMIEAKVVDVTLNNAYQAGINWAAFPNSHRVTAGVFGSNTQLGTTGNLTTGNNAIVVDPTGRTLATTVLGTGLAGTAVSAAGAVGAGVFGLAVQTKDFAALIQFLESQGNVQVLSSPRVAALNNQKAVLKVGTDQFFVTNVTGTPVQTSGGVTTAIQLIPTLNSFFSGVSLDITPQIDEDGNIFLHIHPLVSNVVQQDLTFNFGGVQNAADTTLPLAKSSINETDTVVRVQDGNIVALGGLMKLDVANDRSGIPVLQDIPGVGGLFGNTTRTRTKRELVILLKPTVIKGERDWEEGNQQARDRMQNFGSGARLSPFERP